MTDDELAPFFGLDPRTSLFTKLFITDTENGFSINESNINSVVDSDAFDIMRSQNYEVKSGMMDNDVHNDFTDFLIGIGIFHSKVNAGDAQSVNIINRLKTEWNKLSPFAKRFLQNVATMNLDNNNNVMIKLKDDGCPMFANYVPKYASIFTGIFYTDDSGTVIKYGAPTDEDSLKKIYCDAYNQTLPNEPTNPVKNVFRVNMDDFVRQRLFNFHKNQQAPHSVVSNPVLSLADKTIWFRDNNGLYKMVNNDKIYYNKDSPATMQSLEINCNSTQMKMSKRDCENYVTQCLLSNDPDEIDTCISTWRNRDFYEVSKAEISNMNPEMALKTLQKFGFRAKDVFDAVANRNLRKVESVDSWLRTQLKTKFDRNVSDVIENNDKLINYLSLIVDYVNSNPAILNKDYSGKTNELVGIVQSSQFAQNLGIHLQQYPQNSQYIIAMNELSALQQRLRNARETQSYPHQPLIMNVNYQRFDPMSIPGFMVGGDGSASVGYMKSGADVIYAIFNNTVESLSKFNKIIPKEEQNRIINSIDQLKELEKELVMIEIYLAEFRRLQDIVPQQQTGTSSSNLTIQMIKELVDKQVGLTKSQNVNEENAIELLQNIYRKLQLLMSIKTILPSKEMSLWQLKSMFSIKTRK